MNGTQKQVAWAIEIIAARAPISQKILIALDALPAQCTALQQQARDAVRVYASELIDADSAMNSEARWVIDSRVMPMGYWLALAEIRASHAGMPPQPSLPPLVAGDDGVFDLRGDSRLSWTCKDAKIGELGKLSFDGEAFWVKILSIDGMVAVAEIDNDLENDNGLDWGCQVRFDLGYEAPPSPPKPSLFDVMGGEFNLKAA